MPELNVLPINASTNIELKDELLPFDSSISNDDFSKYIDLHLNENNRSGHRNNIDDVKSEAKDSKKNTSSIDSKPDNTKPHDLFENNHSNDNKNSELGVHDIAAPGKKDEIEPQEIDQKSVSESEELISFLSKAENTLKNTSISQSIDILAPIASENELSMEDKITEQNTHSETQLLLNSSHLVTDLSPIAKALKNEEIGSQILTQKADPSEELQPEFLTEEIGKKDGLVTLSVEAVNKESIKAEIPVELTQSVESKVLMGRVSIEKNNGLSEQEIETKINKERAINNIVSDKENTVSADLKSITKNDKDSTETKITNAVSDKINSVLSQVKADSIIDNKTKNVQNTTNFSIDKNAVKKIDQIKIEMSNDKVSQNAVLIETAQQNEAEEISSSQLPENKAIQSTNNINQTLIDTARPINKLTEKQDNTSKIIQTDIKSTLLESQITENELIQSRATIDITDKSNQTESINKTVLLSNQSITNDLVIHDVKKGEAKDSEKGQLSTVLDEIVQDEAVVRNKDVVLVGTKGTESVKTESLPSSHFIDVSGKATQVTQELISQQSTERVNPSSLTEVTNSQKINAQLHQETISLFRKDFSEAVKDKVMLMISQKLQRFDITLDPPELGNMQVKVNLQGEQAIVNFIVQSQQTKDALEQNMHKLRESLTEQGVEVGDANVEQQSHQSGNEENGGAESPNQSKSEISNISDANDNIAHTLSAQIIDSSTTTVDYYA